MKNKAIFKFIFLCIIAGVMTLNVYANISESTYLEQFNKLTGTNFADNYYLTREDFYVSVSKIFMKDHNESDEMPFEDTGKISPESRYHLSALYAKGILSGTEENGKLYMRLGSSITRQESVTLLGRILSKSSESKLKFSDESSIQSYAYGYIAWFVENGLVTGDPDGRFGPSDRMTARELAALVIRTMNYAQTIGVNIETVFGTGAQGHIDGDRINAMFALPYGILCDDTEVITVFDTYSNAIRTIHSDAVETLAGGTALLDDNGFSKGLYSDGALDKALLNRPTAGVFNTKGELFFVDSANNTIRYVREDTVRTFCGTAEGFKDGSSKEARFNNPMAIAIDKNDYIYVADTLNNCIRKIDTDGNTITIAGKPGKEGYMNGGVSDALFRAPAGIAVSDDGSVIYVSDTGNHVIRKIENGRVTTIAGAVNKVDDGYPLGGFNNGAANEAMFNLPRGIIVVDEVLIVADSGNNMIRAVTKSANVVTIAGNGDPGDSEGPCFEAVLNNPSGISYYGGQLYIADTGNNKIKKMKLDQSTYK